MADRDAELVARIARGVADLDRQAWDALAGAGDPFPSHDFLALLEETGSVGTATGWTPLPILAERDGTIVAAAPAYLKSHSQGEYVFDHGWAEAWQRTGQDYYPKLQVAVPFTPVPGRRLLGDRAAILGALEAVTVQNRLSSAHVTFCDVDDSAAGEARGWLRREGIQYHWFNRDYASFDDFLGALSSRKRKAIRKERAAANARASTSSRCAGPRSGPRTWRRCGTSIWIRGAASGASPTCHGPGSTRWLRRWATRWC